MNSELVRAMNFRAAALSAIRDFFTEMDYTEADVPLLTTKVIPEAPIELFRTESVSPYADPQDFFLLPSPEYYLKKLIAAGSGNIFSISRSFRNSEQTGRIHNPEFSMLEWYTMDSDYMDSVKTAEDLFERLLSAEGLPELSSETFSALKPPFEKISMNELFERHTGADISAHCTGLLSPEEETAELRELAAKLGLTPGGSFEWEELFNLIFVHQVEPELPKNHPVLIYDYPAGVPALAVPAAAAGRLERWELYAGGIELANCYSEETDYSRISSFFENESRLKEKALVPVKTDFSWCELYKDDFPRCSGTAMGIDRLLMLLSGSKSIGGVILFPLSDTMTDF